jgi:hypothetical protein
MTGQRLKELDEGAVPSGDEAREYVALLNWRKSVLKGRQGVEARRALHGPSLRGAYKGTRYLIDAEVAGAYAVYLITKGLKHNKPIDLDAVKSAVIEAVHNARLHVNRSKKWAK